MRARTLVAAVVAVAASGLLITLLYYFFARVWTQLPAWAAVPLSILIAASAIGGPIWTLLRLSDRHGRPPEKRRSPPGDSPH